MGDLIISIPAANAALDTFLIDEVSLHSDNPSTTGDNELASPNYARQSFSFAAAADAQRIASSTATFELTAGDEVVWTSYWYEGNFVIAKQLPVALIFNQDGTATLGSETVLEL